MAFPAETRYCRVGAHGRRREVTFADGVERTKQWAGAWWPVGLLAGMVLLGGALWAWRRWKPVG